VEFLYFSLFLRMWWAFGLSLFSWAWLGGWRITGWALILVFSSLHLHLLLLLPLGTSSGILSQRSLYLYVLHHIYPPSIDHSDLEHFIFISVYLLRNWTDSSLDILFDHSLEVDRNTLVVSSTQVAFYVLF